MKGKKGAAEMQIIRQLTGAVILIVILICNAAAAKIIYVDDNATGNNDGTSWQNAYIYIRDALDDAYHSYKPVEIRVAQGTYTPDQGVYNYPGDHSQESFWIRNRVTLAGGYAGVDANDPNTRDIELYETILSGDLYGNDAEITDLSTLLLD
ncbi:MAG: hypothetical protein JW715_11350, partial [Sedimentisphaerales bacterium]|nr:hypothetical protein [Sedimentisphaerales bacterium]